MRDGCPHRPPLAREVSRKTGVDSLSVITHIRMRVCAKTADYCPSTVSRRATYYFVGGRPHGKRSRVLARICVRDGARRAQEDTSGSKEGSQEKEARWQIQFRVFRGSHGQRAGAHWRCGSAVGTDEVARSTGIGFDEIRANRGVAKNGLPCGR